MESHKCILLCICISACDILIVDICWNCIINIKKCNNIVTYNFSDKFTQCTIYINFA